MTPDIERLEAQSKENQRMALLAIQWEAKEPPWLRRVIFYCVLRPLIIRNMRLRAMGEMPDRWYWADYLAMQWGYFV